MAKQVQYVQCTIRRPVARGSVRTTSYIPRQFAKPGYAIKLKDDQDQWSSGWVVECVGHTIVDAADAPDHRKAIRNHRKSTGDSQPRLK